MIAQDFLDTGWQFSLTGHRITRYQVFGERSSGTNFVKRLLGRNTALAPSEGLGWKHGLPHMAAIPRHRWAIATATKFMGLVPLRNGPRICQKAAILLRQIKANTADISKLSGSF